MVPALTAYKKFSELVALLKQDDQKKKHPQVERKQQNLLAAEISRKFRLTDEDVKVMLDELKRGEIDR